MPVRVLLVNPYIYDFTAYDLWLRPLGLMYVAAALQKYTDCQLHWLDTLDRHHLPDSKDEKYPGRGKFHRVEVEKPAIYQDIPRRYARYGMPWENFLKALDELPDMDIILVTSLMTYWIEGVGVTLDALRQRFKRARIVLGGILPNLAGEADLKPHLDADLFIRGYGESKILDLVETHGAKVSGRPDMERLDSLPFPAPEFYWEQSSSPRSAPLLTSRGCPFKCTYCASGILNPRFMERGAENIWQEISFMHRKHGTTDFAIFDDALLLNKKRRFLRVFGKVKEELNVRFHTHNGLHVGEIDKETAETFYTAGFKTLRLSFESVSHDILSRSSDKVTVRQMEQAVASLETAGYRRGDIGVYLLVGLPGQRLSQVEEALDFASNLGVVPHLSYFAPVPGSRDFLDLVKTGHLSSPLNLYETNKLYFLYTKSGFTKEEIQGLKNKTATIITNAHGR